MILAPWERECAACEAAFIPDGDETKCSDCREEASHA